jgi:hypothetical protein
MNMNTDYGFFQLFGALKSLRDYKSKLALGEERPAIYQKLPQVNYSLLALGVATTCQCPD